MSSGASTPSSKTIFSCGNLKKLFPNKKIYFVLAILRDKKLDTIIKNICEISHKIFIAKNQSARAAEIDEQTKFVTKYGGSYEIVADVVDAKNRAVTEANKNDIVIVSGSLYTISEILKKNNL
ncbi:MAG: hypothetical protein HN952_04010 [Candidatus Cloacimonetes bacterium]|nr:hypothetical protein [Candidatus Cloacimonadota bacterium]